MRIAASVMLCLLLAACGDNPQDRAVSGAGIGAGAGLVGGALVGHPLAGAAIGAGVGGATGALTNQQDLDLGQPAWK